ncbi:hypothetical protein U1Q18_030567 [Sarracenia purpurea var. burkii]
MSEEETVKEVLFEISVAKPLVLKSKDKERKKASFSRAALNKIHEQDEKIVERKTSLMLTDETLLHHCIRRSPPPTAGHESPSSSRSTFDHIPVLFSFHIWFAIFVLQRQIWFAIFVCRFDLRLQVRSSFYSFDLEDLFAGVGRGVGEGERGNIVQGYLFWGRYDRGCEEAEGRGGDKGVRNGFSFLL